jgi:hypothetical protein
MVIVISNTRKTASFSQLLKYINNGREKKDEYSFKNIDSNTHYEIIKEYLENAKFLKKQKNSKILFHEILSLKKQNDLSIEEQREILKDLIAQYIDSWAANHLAYAVIHEKENTLHAHVMISSNEYGNTKNKRLSLSQFADIKDRLNEYAYAKYPQLEKTEFSKKQRERGKARQIDKEKQFEKRTGQQSAKAAFKERLQAIFDLSASREQFIAFLQRENIHIYQRGQAWGFVDNNSGTKYRVKTLGLESDFDRLNARLSPKGPEQPPSPTFEHDKAKAKAKTPGPDLDADQKSRDDSPGLTTSAHNEHTHTQAQTTTPTDDEAAYKRELDDLAERRSQELAQGKSLKR